MELDWNFIVLLISFCFDRSKTKLENFLLQNILQNTHLILSGMLSQFSSQVDYAVDNFIFYTFLQNENMKTWSEPQGLEKQWKIS